VSVQLPEAIVLLANAGVRPALPFDNRLTSRTGVFTLTWGQKRGYGHANVSKPGRLQLSGSQLPSGPGNRKATPLSVHF
jgi:hypothetical protein